MKPLFPEVPQEFGGVEDETLATTEAELLERIREVAANRRDPEVVGELSQAQVTDAMEAAVADLERVRAEIASRAAEEAGYDDRVGELAARAGVETLSDAGDGEEGGDGAGDGEEGADDAGDGDAADGAADASDGEDAGTAASSAPQRASRRALPAARRHREPVATETDSRGFRLTSNAADYGAGLPGGTHLERAALGDVMTDMVKKRVKPGQRVVVAAASYDYPPDRILDTRAGDLNMEKIQRVLGPQAMVASGPLCAPLPAIYDLPGVETAVRPVRDALASFQAARGGVQVGTTPRMGDYDDAVGVVTAAQNAAGGTNAAKSCRTIECPDFESVEVDSIYHCIEADNLASRAYPELMARIDALVLAEQARLADSKLLTEMAAGSTAVTGGSLEAGAVWALLGDVYRLAAGTRSRNRMPEAARLRAIFPGWIVDLLALDVARGQFDRFQTREAIVGILERAGINVAFTLDGSSTATDGQVFGAQTPGAILDFPDTVEWFMFPEASWLHLDSGNLELGVVRDSDLNLANNFQVFGETWEQVAFVGVESFVVTSTVCPSGTVAAPADVAALCGT